jgi:RNA 3'-terminal phosphate cyclase (ATP)
MRVIDGSYGEGGGQILRTSLALALVTGEAVTIEHIRARRPKPGLMRQHLTAVLAAAEVGGAQVEGAETGSVRLVFRPRQVRAGKYHFAIGTAGSCVLVLQTVLPALLLADGPSDVVLEGGTHNPLAPPFEFLDQAFLATLRRLGASVSARLERHGFYPAGGGCILVHVEPVQAWQRLSLLQRGAVVRREIVATVSKIPLHIAEREANTLRWRLNWSDCELRTVRVTDSPGPGNTVYAALTDDQGHTEVFTGFGEMGVQAETVAKKVAAEVAEYSLRGAPVSRHLADQLLLPLALAGGGEFRTLSLTPHTETNLHVIGEFLPLDAEVTQEAGKTVRISLNTSPRPCRQAGLDREKGPRP